MVMETQLSDDFLILIMLKKIYDYMVSCNRYSRYVALMMYIWNWF